MRPSTSLLLPLGLAALLALPLLAQPITINGGVIIDGQTGPINQIVHASGTWEIPAGETLTLESGSALKFVGGIQARINVRGTLILQGSANAPVFITSRDDDDAGGNTNNSGRTPRAGDWNTIQVFPGGRVIGSHARIRYARTSVLINSGSGVEPELRLDDAVIDHALFHGLDAKVSGDLHLNRVAFENITEEPIIDLSITQVENFSGLTAANNPLGPVMGVVSRGFTAPVSLDPSNTFDGSGALAILTGQALEVPAGAELELLAGMVIKLDSGPVEIDGTLRCLGQPGLPVVITSFTDDSFGGDTNGDGNATSPSTTGPRIRSFAFRQGSDASRMEHTIVRHSGGFARNGILITRSAPTLLDCIIEELGRTDVTGLRLSNANGPRIERLIIRNISGVAMEGSKIEGLPNILDVTATNCAGGDYLSVDAGRVNGIGDVRITPRNYPGDVLVLRRGYDLGTGDKITFTDGVILKVASSTFLETDRGAFDFLGTGKRPVIITSLQDDEVGGDTEKNGATSIVPWTSIVLGRNSAPSRVEHVVIRHSRSLLRCSSSVCRLLNLRIEEMANTSGLSLSAHDGPLDNLVIIGDQTGSRDGLTLSGGSFDVRHATIFGMGRNGITASSGWTGAIRNSIAFGNGSGGGVNITRVPVAQVFDTIGAFDGINGNLEVDPLFVDASNGDLRLQAGSPALESADRATAVAVGADHIETPRVLASGPNAAYAPDRGAFESATHTVDFLGTGALGSNLSFDVDGPSVDSVFWFLGSNFGSLPFPGIGIALVGTPTDVLILGPLFPPFTRLDFALPNDPVLLGLEVGAQALVATSDGGTSRLMMTERVRVRFF